MELKDRIIALSGLMSVSGHETYSDSALHRLFDGDFDDCCTDSVGNHIFIRRCGKEGAKKILIDTHFDEIGMIVRDICENGFLRITSIGGLDSRILQGAEVIIYPENHEPLFGIICSTPPHLQKAEDSKTLKDVNDLIIDTGYPKDKISEFVSIGTPVGFKPIYTELLGGCIAGKGFDNKSCAACAYDGIMNVPREELAGDVYLLLSSFEETGRVGGAAVGVYGIDPDYAMVIDVNLGASPDVPKRETVPLHEGLSITYSPITDKKLTKMITDIADSHGIKHQKSVSASHTGTNAPDVNLARCGVPTADIGLPLRSMHTYNEVIALDDAECVSRLVSEFIKSKEIAEVFGR